MQCHRILQDCGLNSCPVPCGRGEQPLKTTLLQEASRPFRACQALKGQTTPASCRRAATRRNLSRKPAAPEIRLSRSPVQWFSGALKGFGAPSPSRPVRANCGLIQRSAGPIAVQCCFSTRNAGADQRVQSRIQELAPVRRWHPRIADPAGPSPGRQIRPGGPYNLSLLSATGFLMLFVPSFHWICNRQKNGRFSDRVTDFSDPLAPSISILC